MSLLHLPFIDHCGLVNCSDLRIRYLMQVLLSVSRTAAFKIFFHMIAPATKCAHCTNQKYCSLSIFTYIKSGNTGDNVHHIKILLWLQGQCDWPLARYHADMVIKVLWVLRFQSSKLCLEKNSWMTTYIVWLLMVSQKFGTASNSGTASSF
jgi:hypothetical protein